MGDNLNTDPTTKTPEQQFDDQVVLMQKSIKEAVSAETAALRTKISVMEAKQIIGSIPPNFLGPVEPFVKSFDEHLREEFVGGNVTFDAAFKKHMELAQESISQHGKYAGKGSERYMSGMRKSLIERDTTSATAKANQSDYMKLSKSLILTIGLDK